MARARITIQHTLEYEIRPENYPGCNSDLERLTLDIENYSQPDVAVEAILMGSSAIAVTGELVKESA